MRPEAAKLLWDARLAADRIIAFAGSKTFDAYAADPLVRSGVERQFEIIGEALSQLRRIDAIAGAPGCLARVIDRRQRRQTMSSDRDPTIESLLDELTRRGPFASLDDVNRALGRLASGYNTRPQAELGGLSPMQMHRLLGDDWVSPNGALRLDASLTLDELAGAALLSDARMMLDYVAAEGPLKETVAHNLPRSAVASLRPRLRVLALRHSYFDPEVRGPLNEGDVYWLAPLRHTLMIAGLLMRRKGFRVTARGRELLLPGRAGELYALLFRTVFRRLNLRVLDYDQHAGLQATVAYTLYRLGSCARVWTSSASLAATAWLESAKDPPRQWEQENEVDHRHYALGNQVLGPLAEFGLIEIRTLPGPASEPWREWKEYRVTPLYDRFLRFELGDAPGPVARLVR